MAGKPTPLLEALRTLGHAIRDAVLAGRARVGDTIPGTTHDADVIRADTDHGPDHQGDTIYRIDVRAEEVVMETAHAWMHDPAHPVPGPFAVIAEGLPGDGWACFPAGTPREAIRTVVIIDPIDGTRGLMHGKRSAWALLASAPGPAILGRPPRLGDIDTAVMAEIPTARARYADTLWATRGNGVRGETLDLATGTVIPARPAPSGATDLSHGFATISKFFPGTKAPVVRHSSSTTSTSLQVVSCTNSSPDTTGSWPTCAPTSWTIWRHSRVTPATPRHADASAAVRMTSAPS